MIVKLEEYCVPVSGTLLDALKVIDQDAEGLAVVLDEQEKVHGTLTDGDIRRALLAGHSLEAPLRDYACTEFCFVGPKEGRAAVLDLMQARRLRQIPVIDASRTLLGVHFLSRVLGYAERSNWAVIMAGGKGTRLRPITEHLPKPMIEVAGRPILERLILHLVGSGVKRIFLAINYMGHVIEEYFGDGSQLGCSIEYLKEDEPLGTGGALSLLPEQPKDPLLVMNGDLIMQANIEQLLAFHQSGSFYATMGVSSYHHEVPFGCVKADAGRIRSLEEKPVSSFLVNAGLYVLSPEAITEIPSQFFPITQLFEQALEQDRSCGCYSIEEEWADVGRINDLKKAKGEV